MSRLVCHPVPLGVKPLVGLMTRYLSSLEIYSITAIGRTFLMEEQVCFLFEDSVHVSHTHLHIYTM